MIDDLQRRVDEYFQSGQRKEPAGRLILDLMRALRKATKEHGAIEVSSVLDTLEDLSRLTSDELQSRIQSVYMWLRDNPQ
jgi:hypothetical protein